MQSNQRGWQASGSSWATSGQQQQNRRDSSQRSSFSSSSQTSVGANQGLHGVQPSSISSTTSSSATSSNSATESSPRGRLLPIRPSQNQNQNPLQGAPISLQSTTSSTTTTSSADSTSSISMDHFGSTAKMGHKHQVNSSTGSSSQQQQQLQCQQQSIDQMKDFHQLSEEDNRKLRLQLYVLVLRCISYPFNAKQSDLHQRHQQSKLRKSNLEQIIQSHTRYIKGSLGSEQISSTTATTLTEQTAPVPMAQSTMRKSYPHHKIKLSQAQLKQLDDCYELVHENFNRKYLTSDRMKSLVESECCSQQDLRDLFRNCIEHELDKCESVFSLKSLAGNSHQHQHQQQQQKHQTNEPGSAIDLGSSINSSVNREAIINLWLMKFEQVIRDDNREDGSVTLQQTNSGSSNTLCQFGAESNISQILSKDQLYQMFQNILNIKKFEHQLLYNALQLDSSDEQAAAIRRELDSRISRIAELERNKKLMPKFVLKEMESLYFEELRMSVNKLMINLDNLPVLKGNQTGNESRVGYGLGQKFRRYNTR